MMLVCKPCSAYDPVSDKVMVDMDATHANAEAERQRAAQATAERHRADEAENRRKHAEQAHKARTESMRREKEAQGQKAKDEAEKQRHQEEAIESERQRQVAEEAEHEEELQRLEQDRAATEALRQRLEEQTAAEAKARLELWLRQEKFTGVNDKRKSMMKAKYPLHSAVKRQDLDLVQLLMRFNADPSLEDSNNLTPKMLAEKSNKDGSYAAIIQALGR